MAGVVESLANNPAHWLAVLLAAAGLALLALLTVPGIAAPAFAGCKNSNAKPETTTTKRAEKAIVCLINDIRSDRGLGRVDSKGDLADAAVGHSKYMQRHNCFAHVCPGEADVYKRLASAGYLGGAASWGYGENIAWGEDSRGTPRNIVEAWMDSPPHREVILTGSYDHVGVGAIWGSPYAASDNAATITADFGYAEG